MTSKLPSTLQALLKPQKLLKPTSQALNSLFSWLETNARKHDVEDNALLTLSAAAITTLGGHGMKDLYLWDVARIRSQTTQDAQWVNKAKKDVAVMREAGLKTISFSGIAKTINSLGELKEVLDPQVVSALTKSPTRVLSPGNIQQVSHTQAIELWNDIYEPHAKKLLQRLGDLHPDLPVHIINCHYGPLLSDPEPANSVVDRMLTSVVAVAALRAQGPASIPQLKSHVFGLINARNSLSSDASKSDRFLTSAEGAEWVIQMVDRIIHVLDVQNVKAKL